MPTSTSERDITLTTDNPQAEILLVDGAFRVIARGPSPLRHRAPPGLYAMKVKVGDQESEELLAVEPDATPFQRVLSAPQFESPIPLARTSTTREYHQSLASRLLAPGGATLSLGHGSGVMVCVRDPSRSNFALAEAGATDEDRAAYAASFSGFRLLDAGGQSIVDLDAQAERNMADGYVALRVELAPGSYALAHRSGAGWVCTPLPCAPGWILQVYINVVPSGQGRFAFTPDLSGMATVFGRVGGGFAPMRDDWLAGETVRQGLLEGRNYIDTPTMRDILTGKFDDPMLGLYGAHLLLVEPTPDLATIQQVVHNLEGLLDPGHPDVVALSAAYERAAGTADQPDRANDLATRINALTGPPLLARSWDALLAHANRHEALLASARAVFAVAGDLVPNGVFVAWRQHTLGAPALPKAAPPAAAAAQADPGKARVVLPPSEETVVRAPAGAPSAGAGGLGGLAGAVVVLAGPFIAAGTRLLKHLRRTRVQVDQPNLAAQIAEIDNTEKAAAALVALARRYDWKALLPELRKSNDWVSQLSGLQRDLVMLLRDASSDPLALEGLTASYVDELLQTHRAPLSTLVEALSDMELSGWLGDGVRKLAARSAANAKAVPAQAGPTE